MPRKTSNDESIRREVDRLEKRVAGMEPLNRLIVTVQIEQLAKAEQLRKLALAVVRHRRRGHSPTVRSLDELEAFVKDLRRFHNSKLKVPDFYRPKRRGDDEPTPTTDRAGRL